jgi:hypothetical protein
LPLSQFWSTLFSLLLPIWPSRTTLPSYPGFALGDIWPCPSLSRALDAQGAKREEGDDLVPFHKLTQWLCYSLVEAIEGTAGWKVERGRGQTGLPEVRTTISRSHDLTHPDSTACGQWLIIISTVTEVYLSTTDCSRSGPSLLEARPTPTARISRPFSSQVILPS